MYLCMYVSMYVCMYVCMHVCKYVWGECGFVTLCCGSRSMSVLESRLVCCDREIVKQ